MIGALHYHYTRFGLRGALALLQSRLRSGPTHFYARHADARQPVGLRIGTSDVPTFDQVFCQREYDFSAPREPRVIVDAGANIGLASVYFASRFPEARIIAIEPELGNFELLKRNLAPYPNAEAVHAALWNANTTIELVDPGLGSWGFMTRSGGAKAAGADSAAAAPTVHRVRALTIEQLFDEFDLQGIDLFKMDIEGAEREVLEAVGTWVDRIDAWIVELHERMKPGCEARFDALAAHYDCRWQLGENEYLSRGGGIVPAPVSRNR